MSSVTNEGPGCPLCGSGSRQVLLTHIGRYMECPVCLSVFLHPNDRLDEEAERARYLLHDDDVHDPGHRDFIRPLIDEVLERTVPGQAVLDYGAGKGPIVTVMLNEQGRIAFPYDPFFWNDSDLLAVRYGAIACCEVIEHFHCPGKEFGLLRDLLVEGGSLICMTCPLTEGMDLAHWHYKEDPTHVFFYSDGSLEWIKDEFGFVSQQRRGRVIVFTA